MGLIKLGDLGNAMKVWLGLLGTGKAKVGVLWTSGEVCPDSERAGSCCFIGRSRGSALFSCESSSFGVSDICRVTRQNNRGHRGNGRAKVTKSCKWKKLQNLELLKLCYELLSIITTIPLFFFIWKPRLYFNWKYAYATNPD